MQCISLGSCKLYEQLLAQNANNSANLIGNNVMSYSEQTGKHSCAVLNSVEGIEKICTFLEFLNSEDKGSMLL